MIFDLLHLVRERVRLARGGDGLSHDEEWHEGRPGGRETLVVADERTARDRRGQHVERDETAHPRFAARGPARWVAAGGVAVDDESIRQSGASRSRVLQVV